MLNITSKEYAKSRRTGHSLPERKQIIITGINKLPRRQSRNHPLRNLVIYWQLILSIVQIDSSLTAANALSILVVLLWHVMSSLFERFWVWLWVFVRGLGLNPEKTWMETLLLNFFRWSSNVFLLFCNCLRLLYFWFLIRWFFRFPFLFLRFSLYFCKFHLIIPIEALMMEITLTVAFSDLVEIIHIQLHLIPHTCLTKDE